MKSKQIIIAFLIFCTLAVACSKINDNLPMDISIVKVSDSLTLKPISFSATVSKTPDSYAWDFGDQTTTSAAVSPTHTYQNMGIFNVVCTVTRKGVVSQASYKLEIKGDSRIVGQRRFYGTHTYTILPVTPLNTANNSYVTIPIADTTLVFTAPSHFQLVFSDGLDAMAWEHDTGNEVLYQYYDNLTNYTLILKLYYYPANDSGYTYINKGSLGSVSHEYKLYQKR